MSPRPCRPPVSPGTYEAGRDRHGETQGQWEDEHRFHNGLGAVKTATQRMSCHLPGGHCGWVHNTSDLLLSGDIADGQR